MPKFGVGANVAVRLVRSNSFNYFLRPFAMYVWVFLICPKFTSVKSHSAKLIYCSKNNGNFQSFHFIKASTRRFN